MSNRSPLLNSYSFEPIGFFHTRAVRPYEAPRQATIGTEVGEIILNPHQLFEQALVGLEEFERIWIIYLFHHNQSHWKPMVQPPRSLQGEKYGLFATRAPYRPNPIGISCTRLLSIDRLKLKVQGSDLLDGTPILDIKPYIPYADAFPDSVAGWTERVQDALYKLQISPIVQAKMDWLSPRLNLDLEEFLNKHLTHLPKDSRHKRVRCAGSPELWIISLRTWRFLFQINEEQRSITVSELYSGYSQSDCEDLSSDPYSDKELHRSFLAQFPSSTLPEEHFRHLHR